MHTGQRLAPTQPVRPRPTRSQNGRSNRLTWTRPDVEQQHTFTVRIATCANAPASEGVRAAEESGCEAGIVEEVALAWVREQCASFVFDVSAVFQRHGDHAWPFTANDEQDLEAKLLAGGHLLPLPKEPAALANILEVAIVDHLIDVAEAQGADVRRGTERGYPDIELAGDHFGGGFHAVDVKVARRAANPARTQSRITLYTGNTALRDERWGRVVTWADA